MTMSGGPGLPPFEHRLPPRGPIGGGGGSERPTRVAGQGPRVVIRTSSGIQGRVERFRSEAEGTLAAALDDEGHIAQSRGLPVAEFISALERLERRRTESLST